MNFQAIEKNVCINFSSLPLAQFPFYINIFASIFFPLFHFFLLLLLIVLPLLFDPRWKESREREGGRGRERETREVIDCSLYYRIVSVLPPGRDLV